jgi:magnesium transporter
MRYRRIPLTHLGPRGTPAAVPGQVIAPKGAEEPTIRVFAYGPTSVVEKEIASLDELPDLSGDQCVLWIDVSSVGDAELILALGERFGLHRLSLEDVVNLHQRPKAEDFDSYAFIIARMLNTHSSDGSEQVSFFLGDGFLISIQSVPGDCFDNVRTRIRSGRGRVRTCSADYLCYALLDTIIDSYYPELERLGETLQQLEDDVVAAPKSDHVAELHSIKRALLMFRRAVWPHREMISALIRDDHELFSKDTQVFLRDCYDHSVQMMDILETYREIASGLIDIYISSISVKLNETMKVLTVIATVFMPLSFIASLYGMNFDRQVSPWNMPELGWKYGYLYSLLLMAVSAGVLVWFFQRNGWLKKD